MVRRPSQWRTCTSSLVLVPPSLLLPPFLLMRRNSVIMLRTF
ncbi:hypothetical protein LINPERPRIM_LOCUS25596 [Linum perenne]